MKHCESHQLYCFVIVLDGRTVQITNYKDFNINRRKGREWGLKIIEARLILSSLLFNIKSVLHIIICTEFKSYTRKETMALSCCL